MTEYAFAPLLLLFPLIGVLFNALFGRRFVQPALYEGEDQEEPVAHDHATEVHVDVYEVKTEAGEGVDVDHEEVDVHVHDADAHGALDQQHGEIHNDPTGERWSGWFASLMSLSAFGVAVALFFSLMGHDFHGAVVPLFDWFRIPAADFHVPWAMQIDTLSVTMMLVVTGVGSLIHIYSIGYMHGDPNFSRFFTYLNLFLFFMLILISANNYLMLFVGWEGVGLCSFLLIGFWFDRVDDDGVPMNANAARKAFVANRVGDFAMILAMILLFWTFHTLNFNPIFDEAIHLFEEGQAVSLFGMQFSIATVLAAVTTLFLIGAAGKSAQIPLYVWLPDAMAGPTPVSALIHAATMVTSGIYLIVRSNVLFEIVRVAAEAGDVFPAPTLVAYTGAITALFAGLIAFTRFDIKKVLAYSTVSQLGFMVAAAGMGIYVAAMFHLITHAFFKALLFLGAGSVIHGVEHGHHSLHDHLQHDDLEPEEHGFDPQDMRVMGGLRHQMPVTFWVYLIGALALSGIFPLAGFWSKDEILAHAYNPDYGFFPVYIILTLAAIGTAFYMGRQVKMVFFGEPRHPAAEEAHESPSIMTIPLIILAVLAVVAGAINIPYIPFLQEVPDHPHGFNLLLEQWLEHSIPSFHLSAEGLLNMPYKPPVFSIFVGALSLLLALGAFFLAYSVIYGKRPTEQHEEDPIREVPVFGPIISAFGVLPLDTLYMRYLIPGFNRFADWAAYRLDWAFWHDFVHDNLIRDFFVGFSRFASDVLDDRGVDGALVEGSARFTRAVAGVLRLTQTGYVRNYALGLFLGVVVLLAYFLLVAG
ncbi:MAG: NADH-quinone oxidoreductase subunit L [Candidatus Promineifilaceae bacterium]|nr:NADH-quinone oxidoreductase subunit L [Candidatus Promineifilaceae bacterium]